MAGRSQLFPGHKPYHVRASISVRGGQQFERRRRMIAAMMKLPAERVSDTIVIESLVRPARETVNEILRWERWRAQWRPRGLISQRGRS